MERLQNSEVPRLSIIYRLSSVTDFLNLLEFKSRNQNRRNSKNRVRIFAPETVDETLFNKIVDVLSILNKQYDKVIFDSLNVVVWP